MLNTCTLYVDESGDLGIKRGSDWFIITGVLVNTEDEKKIRDTIKALRTKFNLNEIHLNKTNDYYRIAYIVDKLKDLPFTIINILMDTNKCELRDSMCTYNFMCRILIERASWYMRDNSRYGKIIFASRGTKRDGELVDYITNKLLPYEDNKIESSYLTSIKTKPASELDLLQLADICANSIYKSVQVNKLGFVTPCHIGKLKNHIYAFNGKILNYGIKYYKQDMKPEPQYLNSHSLCYKK